jgi:hypothetical protein
MIRFICQNSSITRLEIGENLNLSKGAILVTGNFSSYQLPCLIMPEPQKVSVESYSVALVFNKKLKNKILSSGNDL